MVKKKNEETETAETVETEETEESVFADITEQMKYRAAEGKSVFGLKLVMLRELVNRQDWRNDKYVSGTNVSYPYLSIDKIKKTMAPLFSKAGLELTPKFKIISCEDSFQGKSERHWVVRLKATITDIDSGESDVSVVFGEASDRADKGLIKAQTYALKAFFASKFVLADGIDPDAMDGGETRAFKPKSEEETAEIKSKILNAGVKKPAEPAKTVPKLPKKPKTEEKPENTASKAEKPAEEPKKEEKKPEEPKREAPTASEPEKPAKKAEKPAKKTVSAPENGYKPAGPINNAIMQLMENVGNKYQEGKLSDETVKAVQDAYNALASDADATAFIKKYRGL